MKLLSIKIRKGMFEKKYNFSEDVNLMYSLKNSVGKTTLMRMIVYSLAYPAPSTKGLKFEKYEFFLDIITTSNKKLQLYRRKNYYAILTDNEDEFFSLPVDIIEVQKKIFEIDNITVLQNLLGVFYVDQEKGWTLLNRGTVLGGIHFNINLLVQGLSNRVCDDLYTKLSSVQRELQKYKHMASIADYQISINKLGENIVYDTFDEELKKQIDILRFERKPLQNEAKRLESIIKKNVSFKKYIESMKLFVISSNGERVAVNENTLDGFLDNFEYLATKRTLISNDIVVIDNKINTIKIKLDQEQELFTMERMIENFDSNISNIKIDAIAVDNVIKQLDKEKKIIENAIMDSTKLNNSLVVELHELICTYCRELGVDDLYIGSNSDYIFTSDLKSLSGAILHKIVFAFKLSYIKSVEKYTNNNLPILLDSPSGREVDQINVNDMMKILERDFSNHQIIIASIYKYDFIGLNVIEMKGKLLDF